MVDDKNIQLNDLLQSNKGFITLSDARKNNIPYSVIKKQLTQNFLVAEERGLYRLPNAYLDELFVLQHRFPKGIFTLETALWLHGLSLTIPFESQMSFPYSTNTKAMKEAKIKPIILRSHYDKGITEVKTPAGQMVKVYNIERTLVECLRPIYKVDVQIIAPAFKKYAKNNNINYSQLFYYAKLFKVQNKLQSYLEVL